MSEAKQNEHGHEKQVTIVINGRERVVTEKELSFDDLVTLAYGQPDYEKTIYTITYFQNEHDKHEGSLVRGQSVHVKDGMIFTVIPTTKS